MKNELNDFMNVYDEQKQNRVENEKRFVAHDDCLTDDCCDIACCLGSCECCDCLMSL